MKVVFSLIVVIHGLIHLMGFAKAFNLAELNELKKDISPADGVLWLLSTVMILAAIILFLSGADEWWIVGAVAVFLSQIVIIKSWTDAKWGTIANIIILIPVMISFMNSLPSSFSNIYKTEVDQKLSVLSNIPVLAEDDLNHLPHPVKKYLHYTGAVGKPEIINFRLGLKGRMKTSGEGKWLNIKAQQFSFYDDPARFFYIRSQLYGVPFDGLHIFRDNRATMQIKLASLFQVVDARGSEMNQSETVTFFNDLCLFAPSGLADPNIQWKTIDSLSVEATYTNLESTIKAQLFFNEKGELLNFISNDRYQSMDGEVYNKYKWSTPVKAYKDLNGRRVPAQAEAVWHLPEGKFTYADFQLVELEYNIAH